MGLGDPAVIVEHIPLVVRHDVEQVVLGDIGPFKFSLPGKGELSPDVLEEKGKAVRVAVGEQLDFPGLSVGDIGGGVDGKGDKDKAQHREKKRLGRPGAGVDLSVLRPVPQLLVKAHEVKKGKADAGIKHRPLAGRPQPPEKP